MEIGYLRFKKVSERINNILNRITKPMRAPIETQYQYPLTNIPLDFKIAVPTVAASMLASLFGCNRDKESIHYIWNMTFY